jgi:iron complex outermembrane receptor protein
MRDGRKLWLMLAFVLVAVVSLATPAAAQEAEDPADDEGEIPEAGENMTEDELIALAREPFGGEVTVTARRREEALQSIPVAVSVVTSDTLEDIAATDISELQQFAPNLSIYAGRNQSSTMTAFIRGIGQADPLWGVDPGVGLYVDDVYIARPQGALLDVYDVGRVEVLRGPQGTLYGKNTIGGAIKYVTNPMSDTPTGRVTWNPGTYNTQELRASISGPLIKGKLRGKAAFAWLTRDGYGENTFQNRDVSDKNTKALRLGLEWVISDKVDVNFSYDRIEDDAEPKGLTRLEANQFCPLYGAACPPYDDLFDTESGLDPANSYEGDGISMLITWDMAPGWAFKSITAYRDSYNVNNIDFDTTPYRITDVRADYWDDQFTQEFQVVYEGGEKWSAVMGFFYLDGEAGGLVQNIFFGDLPFALYGTTDGTTYTESFAIYGEANWRFADNWTLNLGLRPTRETKRGVAFNAGYTDDTFTEVAVVTADYDKEATFESLAPNLGIDWQINPDVMAYAKVSQGFKSGGFNVRAQEQAFPDTATPFDDEKLTMYELGLKTLLANQTLVLNIAAFYGDYTDVQVSTFTSYDSNGDGIDDAFYGAFGNAGDATNKGLEIEYAWNSQSWFGLSGFLAYLDATPNEFLDENEDGFVDTQVITNAPEWTGTLRANFDWQVGGGLLTASAGYAYRSESVLTNEGGPDPRDPTGATPLLPLTQDAFGLVDAWIQYLTANGKWRFGLSGKNLTDEEYLTNGYNLPVLGVIQGSYGAPRTFVATVEFRFF